MQGVGIFDRLWATFSGSPPATPSERVAPPATAKPTVAPKDVSTELPDLNGFIGGSVEPHIGREAWPLKLFRDANGKSTLALVAHGNRQPIYAIHQVLEPFLARLPEDAELWYLCRVADGTHYNVRHLIALEPVKGFEPVVEYLDPAFVESRPDLMLFRAKARKKKDDEAGALSDLRAALLANVDDADAAYRELTATGRQTLATEFSAWLAPRPVSMTNLRFLPLEHWPPVHLTKVAEQKSADPLIDFELEPLLLEMERRALAGVKALRSTQAHRMAITAAGEPSSLLPELLQRTLQEPSAERLAIYADALCEAQHVYGEFLSLSLRGGASLKKATRLAKTYEHGWLGPLAKWVSSVEYERGLPVAVELGERSATPLALADVMANPLLASLRRVLRRRSKTRRQNHFDGSIYSKLAAALLPLGLREIECGPGTDEWEPALLKHVTHVHDLDLLTRGDVLDPETLPQVTWVEVAIAPGSSLNVYDWLVRDQHAFFDARRPHLEVFIHNPSGAEVNGLRALAPQLKVSGLTLNGEPLPSGNHPLVRV